VLLKIDPIMDAWTNPISPFTSARMLINSSTAFPKVAFKRPPRASPILRASCSVANDKREARGMTARKEKTKTMTSD
jgi:hypothetical protein